MEDSTSLAKGGVGRDTGWRAFSIGEQEGEYLGRPNDVTAL
jgi:hypothetical protein